MRNGQSKVLRCLAAHGRSHRWEAFRVKGNGAGQRIDVSRNLDAGALSFTTDDTVNTGDYRCVDARDDRRIYDRFIILTASESVYNL